MQLYLVSSRKRVIMYNIVKQSQYTCGYWTLAHVTPSHQMTQTRPEYSPTFLHRDVRWLVVSTALVLLSKIKKIVTVQKVKYKCLLKKKKTNLNLNKSWLLNNWKLSIWPFFSRKPKDIKLVRYCIFKDLGPLTKSDLIVQIL